MATSSAPANASYTFDDRNIRWFALGDFKHFELAMLDIDRRLENAARSMGAGTASVIWHVILPLIMPGIAAAALLVFIVSTGFFITPGILGSPSDMMISNLIDYYVHELINFNNAAALAVLVAVVLAPIIVLQQRVAKRGQYGVG